MVYLRSVLLPFVIVGMSAAQTSESSPAAAKQYQALLAEYTSALEAFQKAARGVTTAEARQKVFEEKFPHARLFAPRFMQVAERYPDQSGSVEALSWVVTHPVELTAPESKLRPQALAMLQKHHLGDIRLGRLCTGLVFTIDAASEAFLRTVFSRATLAASRARACASLAHNFKYRSRLIRTLRDDAEMLAAYEKNYGKAVISELMKQDGEQLLRESRKLFEYVQKQYGKMEHPTHGTLARFAAAHLASIERPVQLDQSAPEIEGRDLDDKPLRLSEFKGKVVLLDFGGLTNPASAAMFEYQRELVKRLAGKPFVLLGVSSDADRAAAAKQQAEAGNAWRVWWDGGHVGGPIATRWEVDQWPTLYLIDHKGIVRHLSLGWPDRKTADETIDKMVAEAMKGDR